MKKYILSAIAVLSMSALAFGQLSLQDSTGATINNGDTIKVYGVYGFQLSTYRYIYNSSLSTSGQVLCVPTKDTTSGCTYSVCIGTTCYPPKAVGNNFLSPKFTIPAGKNPNAFYADYNATNPGTTIIRYDIRNSLATDSTWVYIEFIATPTGIAPVINNVQVSSLYPNPATNTVKCAYHTDVDAQFGIYNSLGQLMQTVSAPASKSNVEINVAGIPSGIYICKLQATSGLSAVYRKLVVSH